MAGPKQALGRGLSALLSTGKGGHAVIQELSVNSISPNRNQPRKRMDPGKLAGLAASIKEQGVVTPVIVRRTGSGFEIIAGERRWRASQAAGLRTIPAVVRDANDRQTLVLALVENIQREDLNPMEEAASYQILLKDLTQEELAKQVGKDRATVANSLRLLKLPQEIQQAVREGRISAGHARAILSLDTPAAQMQLYRRIIKGGMSVRQAEDAASHSTHSGGPRKKAATTPYRSMEEDLSRALGTRVKIKGAGKKGSIVIRYYSEEELERLAHAINKAAR
jgi:ParB family chromosome partitioning protein